MSSIVKDRVVLFALPWNLFHTQLEDPPYGLAASFLPTYAPSQRGQVLRLFLNLTAGLLIDSVDPRGSGLTVFMDPPALVNKKKKKKNEEEEEDDDRDRGIQWGNELE